MHITLLHHGRKWRRVENHMRCEECPECGVTVHVSEGHRARKKHEHFHLQLAEILQSVSDRVEIEPGPPVPWTAAVGEDEPDELPEGA